MQSHATVVSINGNGVVLRGPSGSGKSDLALRLISGGAVLVADDRCNFLIDGDIILASAPSEIAGMLEIRGLGLYRLDYLKDSPVVMVVNLIEARAIERLPESALCSDFGNPIPSIQLAPYEASAPDKVRMALRHVLGELETVS